MEMKELHETSFGGPPAIRVNRGSTSSQSNGSDDDDDGNNNIKNSGKLTLGSGSGRDFSSASRNASSAALLAVQEHRLDPTRQSNTDPQRVLFPSDFKRLYTPKGSMATTNSNSDPTTTTTTTTTEIISDPSHEDFDMRNYYVEFVDKWFPGRPLGAFLEFRDLTFEASVVKDKHVKTVWTEIKRLVGYTPSPTPINFSVLDGVSGYLEPGDMCVILGGPSSGKSSLLKALSDRLNNDMRGLVQINGKPIPYNFNRICGYVPQNDVHIPTLTVQETLDFASELQLPEEMPSEEKKKHVAVILKLLGLSHAANTAVGNSLIRGVSGGEKKRVTIGVELLKTPNVMLFDEPTTGLDSAAAYKVLSHVRSIADVGFPCMVSLLQPSKELYELFNQVLIISSGQVVYFGARERALDYFASIGIPCPKNMNPAEFLAQVADHPEKFVSPTISATLSTQFFRKSFRNSDVYAELGRKLWKGVAPEDCPPAADVAKVSKFSNGLWNQFKLNFSRAVKINLRDPAALQVRISRSIFTGFLIATLFLQLDNGFVDARNKLGVLVNVVGFLSFGAVAMVPLYLDERAVYQVQRASKYFQPSAYFLAVNLADVPFTAIEVILFSVILYFTCGLRSGADYFFYFLFMSFGTALYSNTFSRALTSISPSFSIANAVIPSLCAMFFLFCGYLVPYPSFPQGWKWMYWISPLHYGYEGLALNEFDNNPIICNSDELVPPSSAANFTDNFPYGFNGTQACPYAYGQEYLAVYGVQMGNNWKAWDIVIMYIYYLFFLFVGFFTLKYSHFDVAHNPLVEDAEEKAARRRALAEKALAGKQASTVTENTSKAYLEFKNLSYSVEAKDDKGKTYTKTLLTDINGYVKPGTMVALMGPSGAGKTTLLDVLADRKTGGTVTGEILVNGVPRNDFFKRISGYCEQQDIHFSRHTVREAITFAAICRLPEEMPLEQKLKMVQNVISELDMEDIENDLVGSLAEGGLTPEQRKRLTIAVELVTDPPLLFLDEPTSGLDAYGAALVMKKVAEIAYSGRSVICTIHQPSSELFLMFDHLLLLKKGGRQVFFGPVGENLSNLLGYIKTHFGIEFKNDRNPADWMMDTVCEAPNIDGAQLWDQSKESAVVKQTLATGITPPNVKPPHFDRPRFATTLKTQLKEVFPRTFQMFWRNPTLIKVRFLIYLCVGFVLGSFLWFQDHGQLAATNRVAIIFFGIIFVAFNCQSAIGDIMDMRTVYYREKMAGTYRVTAFALSIVFTEVPFHVVYTLVYVLPMYWISGLNTDAGAFFFFFLVFFSTYLCALSFAQVFAVISPNPAVANALAPTLSTFFFMFAGFLIPKDSIGWYWRWFYYLNYFSYAIKAFVINEFSGAKFNCDSGGYVNVTSPYDPSQYKLYCPITTGEDLLASFNIVDEDKWENWGIVLCFYAFFTSIVFLGLRYYNAMKR